MTITWIYEFSLMATFAGGFRGLAIGGRLAASPLGWGMGLAVKDGFWL